MKKRLIKICTLVLVIFFAIGCCAGCASIITTDNRKDMSQIVAEVNVGKDKTVLKEVFSDVLPAGESFSLTDSQVDQILKTDAEVSKLDLVSYFINYGYNYVSQGYSYSQTFELMMNSLTGRKMVIQFATLYYLNAGKVELKKENVPDATDVTNEGTVIAKELNVTDYLAAAAKSDSEALQYLLSEDNYNFALYGLRESINNAIDSYEKDILKITDDDSSSSSSSDARTIPTGATEEQTNSYPKTQDGKVDYQVYTGYNTADRCGEYEKVEGSNVVTRKQAYNKFISALQSNYLLGEEDNITKLEELPYFENEMKNQLEQMVINNFSNTLLVSMSRTVGQKDLEEKYDEILKGQQTIFKSVSEYNTALDSVGDNSFILYAPKSGFGFVYNILLPFSTAQSSALADLQSRWGANYATNPNYYVSRNALLKNIRATDQRATWFNGTTDYSYRADEGEYYSNGKGSDYLFFEDNQGKIEKYAGKYPYNGKVEKNDDDTYTLTPNRISIDDFLDEMIGYVNFVVGEGSLEKPQNGYENGYFDADARKFTDNTGINYAQTIYYTGHVNGVKDVPINNYLEKDTKSYKALSAMNDLMFAYTTDTACLNKYFGYTVAGKGNSTSYVKEFEFAAQNALLDGAGTVCAVAADFGWHIIYVTYVYNQGEIYAGYKHDERNTEGTFSNFFYNAYKDVIANQYASEKSTIVTTVLKDSAVKVYENRYKDLSSIQTQTTGNN